MVLPGCKLDDPHKLLFCCSTGTLLLHHWCHACEDCFELNDEKYTEICCSKVLLRHDVFLHVAAGNHSAGFKDGNTQCVMTARV